MRNKNGGILKRVNTNQLRYLYAVKTSIENAAETKTTFILVDGDQPNAFAGIIRGHGKAIGVNFAMLDLLGLDMHAMAALIVYIKKGDCFFHVWIQHVFLTIKSGHRFTPLPSNGRGPRFSVKFDHLWNMKGILTIHKDNRRSSSEAIVKNSVLTLLQVLQRDSVPIPRIPDIFLDPLVFYLGHPTRLAER